MRSRSYGLTAVLILSFCFAAALPVAAQYELKELTPAVKAALDARKERYEMLAAFKQQGVIGENNMGYVTLLKESSDAGGIVENENRDRKAIYAAIAEQNGLLSEMKSIEKVFAQVQRDKAASGVMIQLESGEWSAK